MLTHCAERERPVYVWCGQADEAHAWAGEWRAAWPEHSGRCFVVDRDTDPVLYAEIKADPALFCVIRGVLALFVTPV